ncbi:MAG: hypothetical protein A2504_04565 [Bdellovibrionales bacterium RIFOXYD12_FULL_39_22]|nr:MAG: hypothetical protein A2385_07260 [Bdellovibrionales bacterium RIFOXYB1_FULL_39_21]OFZ42059.1 MAG: hypothetical protein A2485_09230 [Bdellovibrionales bacterium RIFOXYC12_FULL_39_17]OFZ50775.1 MAG: hypothetical protein A2404_06180 [Bdellovibrionales bacterium RIFOXYC1_FULL_39_130]OFZ77998.1 MAG: hypothetical protein A2560_01350 [Bdellovibrionales bacterium RIFOXYD1_FULL_39_84]OFZ93566.1 MAG: hypothetical protein A2504_04565 [Bdellovibrionales bacterium RIFOXYD12_FULL_39_22]HLE10311.1 am
MNLGAENNEIKEQINKLFSSILIEQQKINAIKGPDVGKENLIQTILDDFASDRGATLFFNYLSSGKGHGPFSQLVDGSVKYDLIEGIGVNLLGHSHPLYIKAHLEMATCDTVMCGNLLSYDQARQTTKAILDSVKNSRLKHFWYACSGSLSNDIALKIIWQKKAPKYKIFAFEKAFAGRSVATQDITYNAGYREGMLKTIPVTHVPHYDYTDPEGTLDKTLRALNDAWNAEPDAYAALMMELVQGEAGFIYGTKEYYSAIFKWAKEKGLYVWVDEVQSFARTHQLFAFQMFGLDEYVDVVTIGKVAQVCGAIYTDELNPKKGLIAGTFNGSMVALDTARKTLRYLQEGNFYGPKGRIAELESIFINKLKYLANNSCKGKIGYIGGVGTMISFEVGDSTLDLTNAFIKNLFNNGVIAFSAGKNPARVRFLLPLSLTDHHIDEIFKIIDTTVHQTIS